MTFSGIAVRVAMLSVAALLTVSTGRAQGLTTIEIPPLTGKFSCTCEKSSCGNGYVGGYNTFTQNDIPAETLRWYLPPTDIATLAAGATSVHSAISGWRCRRA